LSVQTADAHTDSRRKSPAGRPPFSADFERKAQIEDAADSVCRNISEGFAGTQAVLANYLRIARRSLNEVEDGSRRRG
jgi:four helix bundle protein